MWCPPQSLAPHIESQPIPLTQLLSGSALRGYAAPETGRAYQRARELWEQLGSPSEFLRVPCGQSLYHTIRGEFSAAHSLAEDLLRLSGQRNDTGGLVLGHYSAGLNLLFRGELAPSKFHLEKVLALYDPASHGFLAQQAVVHPQVAARIYLGIVYFSLGFPDQARSLGSAALAEAEQLNHPPSLAVTLAFGVMLLALIGDLRVLDSWSRRLVAVTTEQNFPVWRAIGEVCGGWVTAKNGEVEKGISLLRRGSAAYRDTGAQAGVPLFSLLLADAYWIDGRIEEAAALLDEVLQLVDRTGGRWLEAELIRRKAELLLRQGRQEATEELYRNAIAIAVEQSAKLWELRATISLAQLRRDLGDPEARELLAPVYAGFRGVRHRRFKKSEGAAR